MKIHGSVNSGWGFKLQWTALAAIACCAAVTSADAGCRGPRMLLPTLEFAEDPPPNTISFEGTLIKVDRGYHFKVVRKIKGDVPDTLIIFETSCNEVWDETAIGKTVPVVAEELERDEGLWTLVGPKRVRP